jgi:hypothetical protein
VSTKDTKPRNGCTESRRGRTARKLLCSEEVRQEREQKRLYRKLKRQDSEQQRLDGEQQRLV